MANNRTTASKPRGPATRGRSSSSKRGGGPASAPGGNVTADIWGVALTVLALAVGISVFVRGDAPVPQALAALLGMLVGVGRFVVPVVLVAWAISIIFDRAEVNEFAVGGGLGLAFLAIITMFSAAVPVGESFWARDVLIDHGGYLGGGAAWAMQWLGSPITYVVLSGALVIGLVLATGMRVADVGHRVAGLFVRPDRLEEPRPLRRELKPGARTLPLRDLDAGAGETPAAPSRARRDPETERRTVPTPRVATPRRTEGFELPSVSMLRTTPASAAGARASDKELKATATLIEQTLATFDIPARVENWIPGPTVTQFEVKIAKGVKVNRVTALSDDLALALATPTVRVLAPIPGKSLIGIEAPNSVRGTVTLGDVLVGNPVPETSPLMLAIGKDVAGERIVLDLAGMPHLLIAGSTGTGKSVCINALLVSIIMRSTPDEVRLILIDPKRIELSLYNGVPHLYVPVVTEAKEAASALAWAVSEMDGRLKRLQKAQARNIAMYNAMAEEGTLPEGMEAMPYIVIVIDELADLMMVAAREVEDSICRLAQLARAAGIHLIVATQRPSTDIITGLIKTNITNRIAFAVSSGIDSRVILDTTGAEKLVGLGDMLLSTPSLAKPKRIQGAYVSEDEIHAVVDHLKKQAEPEYHEEILHLKVSATGGGLDGGGDDDPLVWEAADITVTTGFGSTSTLQRRLKVGYARAGRIMDMLEQKGIVGPPNGSKPRDVLVDIEELESIKAFERHDARED